MNRRINPNINFINVNLIKKFRQVWKLLDAVGDWIERNADKLVGSVTRTNAAELRRWTESFIDTQFSPNTKRRYVYLDIPKQESFFLAGILTFIEQIQDLSIAMDAPDLTEQMINAAYAAVDKLGTAAFEHSGN